MSVVQLQPGACSDQLSDRRGPERSVATRTNKSCSRPTEGPPGLLKRRPRTKVPLKPKVVPRSVATTEGGIRAWGTTPRTLRARIERARAPRSTPLGATNRRRKSEAVAEQNQPLARSDSTGKVALGPWNGAFLSNDAVQHEEDIVLYLDKLGMCHLSLDEANPGTDLVEQKDTGKMTQIQGQSLAAESPAGRRAHTREVTVLQAKPPVKWSRKGSKREGKRGHFLSRIAMINQPKRGH